MPGSNLRQLIWAALAVLGLTVIASTPSAAARPTPPAVTATHAAAPPWGGEPDLRDACKLLIGKPNEPHSAQPSTDSNTAPYFTDKDVFAFAVAQMAGEDVNIIARVGWLLIAAAFLITVLVAHPDAKPDVTPPSDISLHGEGVLRAIRFLGLAISIVTFAGVLAAIYSFESWAMVDERLVTCHTTFPGRVISWIPGPALIAAVIIPVMLIAAWTYFITWRGEAVVAASIMAIIIVIPFFVLGERLGCEKPLPSGIPSCGTLHARLSPIGLP